MPMKLPEMMFRSAAEEPPIVLPVPPDTNTPLALLPIAAVPAALVPIMLPKTPFPLALIRIPLKLLPEITLPWKEFSVASTKMPPERFGRAAVPPALTPT